MSATSQSTVQADARPGVSRAVGYYVAFIALGLTTASLGPTLPGLAENTASTLQQISYLFTTRSLGYLIGSYVGGFVYDRKIPGHYIMSVMLLLMGVLLALAPTVSLLWVLSALLLLLGMAEGGLDVGGNTLLVWAYREKVGPFMGGLHFFYGVGAFLSPVIVSQMVLLYGGNIRPAYWLLALLMLPAIVWLLRLPSPLPATDAKGQPVGRSNPVMLALIVAFFFLYVGAEGSFGGWIYTFVIKRQLAGVDVAGYLNSTYWAALTLGRLVSIPLMARYRPATILFADLLGSILSVGLILAFPDSLTVFAIGVFGAGFCMASVFPVTLVLAERRMRITGSVTAWFFVGASAGGMFFPWLIGQMFEGTGPLVLITIIFVDLCLTFGVYGAMMWLMNRSSVNVEEQA